MEFSNQEVSRQLSSLGCHVTVVDWRHRPHSDYVKRTWMYERREPSGIRRTQDHIDQI